MTTVEGGNAGRRKAAGELRRSEERFRLLVESVIEYAIFMLDPTGVVISWNAGAQRLKGYTTDEIVGQHYSVFYTPDNRSARLPDRLLNEAREQGHVANTGWRVRKDGSRFWADVVITALYDDSGQHTGFAKVTRDMTDPHLAEKARERALEQQELVVTRLEELDRWRRHFIGSVLHDLQTPVTAIDGFITLLRDGHFEEEERRAVLESVLSNARSLQDLINNLRAYTALAEGQVRLVPDRIALPAFVRHVIADTSPLLGDRDLEVDVADIEVLADSRGLERVLRNLLTNVARHTPASAAVRITARADGDTASIEVEDRGNGIPEELLPVIFQRFEKGGAGGTGLGLAIAKEYVELQGGTISAHSVAGEGSTFRFTLPTR